MARAHTVWLVVINDKPAKAFTVKHECQAFLRDLKGWNIVRLWKLPDGTRPIFSPKELDVAEFRGVDTSGKSPAQENN